MTMSSSSFNSNKYYPGDQSPAGPCTVPACRDRAIILPLVMVLLALLGLLAISFAFSTRAELGAVRAQSLLAQARAAAGSGIEAAALLLTQKFEDSSVWNDNPQLFKDITLRATIEVEPEDSTLMWRYSLVGPTLWDDHNFRYGLTDEASKVNINTASPDMLGKLPGMTEEMVDALCDWREQSDKPRAFGAKDEYYLSLQMPYRCKNGPLDTVEELLLVKGFTAEILFGEDMNRNGMLDPNEDDGSESLPPDNGDGILNRGLYPYVTVYSREPEVTGKNPYQPRINIVDWPQSTLKAMLPRCNMRDEVVKFILMAGKGCKRTPAELFGYKHNDYRADNAATTTSPVTIEDLPAIMDCLTSGYKQFTDGYVYGRININTAPREVLATIGKLTETEIDAIIATRERLDSQSRKTIAWLVTEEVLKPEKFKQVAYLFTARSFQFTVEALGYAQHNAVVARIQAVLDLRLPRVQYLYWLDLPSLGMAYKIDVLGESDEDTLVR